MVLNMTELIIIETTQFQQVKKLLKEAHIEYKIYQEPPPKGKEQQKEKEFQQKLIADYKSVARSKKIQKEMEV